MTIPGSIRYPCMLAGMLAMLASAPAHAQLDLGNCGGPAPDVEPGSVEWLERDLGNIFCTEQRHLDQLLHPVSALPLSLSIKGIAPLLLADAYRAPVRHANTRFRFDTTTIEGLAAEVYRPCATGTCANLPDTLQTFEPPYPAVVVVHGGGARRELYWWASQPMAEAGYLVVAFDSAGTAPTLEEAQTVLDWLFAREDPLAADFDGQHAGIAGHSAGGVVATRLGQADERISALVAWDRAQSGPMPEDLPLRSPAMFQFADYLCQQVPVCQPEPYLTPPDPDGSGNKGEDFQRLRAAGVDSMQIALRAALHLDWTPSEAAGNRYAEIVSIYYSLAWFDRYLKGADDPAMAGNAFARLTAPVFDDSADIHNLSQGFYDPVAALTAADPYAGNVPYRIEGMPTADRLSFYFDSKCDITMPGSSARAQSDDMRSTGCTVTPGSGTANDGTALTASAGGSGGCTLNPGNRDAGLPLLLLTALAAAWFRSKLSGVPTS